MPKRTKAYIANKKEVFLQAYKKNTTNVSKACEIAGISRWSYYDWRKNDKEFEKKCIEIEESLIDMVESKLYHNIKEGVQSAIEFFLKNRASDKWKERVEQKHVGKIEMVHYYLPKNEDKENILDAETFEAIKNNE